MEDKDYKKLYEEAVERAKYALTTDMDNSGHWAINYIFPQLNENKDEKIRKALIHLVKSNKEGSFGIDNYDGIKWDDILSWIEIQEEHKHFRDCIQTGDEVTRNQDGNIVNLSQLKRIAKPKPKFKIGDWVQIGGGNVMKILEVKKDVLCYKILNWYGNESVRKISDIDSIAHLWTIQNAKDGDVLYFSDETIVIFKDLYNSTTFHSYCHIEDGIFDISKDDMPDWWEGKGFQPATKEQRDFLFQKMKENGYEWNAEKKELKKIEQESTWNEKIKGLNELETYILSLVPDRSLEAIKVDAKNIRYIINKEQKTSWSEEDEKMLQKCINELESERDTRSGWPNCMSEINWLKSFKDRIQPQPKQEWSEDDESMLTRCIGILGKCYMGELPTKVEEELEWLKSVELQSHWKPSEEQLKTLWDAIVYVEDNNSNFVGGCMLKSLYKDLKKL